MDYPRIPDDLFLPSIAATLQRTQQTVQTAKNFTMVLQKQISSAEIYKGDCANFAHVGSKNLDKPTQCKLEAVGMQTKLMHGREEPAQIMLSDTLLSDTFHAHTLRTCRCSRHSVAHFILDVQGNLLTPRLRKPKSRSDRTKIQNPTPLNLNPYAVNLPLIDTLPDLAPHWY